MFTATTLLLVLAALAILGGLRMATGPNVRDASLKLTRALPNGAATVYSNGIDTGAVTTAAQQPGNVDWLLTAPALTTTQQPDAKTTIYSILMDDALPIDGSSTVLYPSVITQTGAGSAGSAAATFTFRIPSNAKRYIGWKAVGSTTGNNSASSGTLEVLA